MRVAIYHPDGRVSSLQGSEAMVELNLKHIEAGAVVVALDATTFANAPLRDLPPTADALTAATAR